MRFSPALGFAVAAFLLLLSLPGIPEEIRALAELLGMSEAEWHWWNYTGVCFALILMFFSVHPVWRRLAGFVSEGRVTVEWRVIAPLVALVVASGAIIGAVIYLFTVERPSFVWAHPTMTLSDQEKAKAECRMAAYEAIGGGRGGIMDPSVTDRSDYVATCLTSRGFKRVQVKADSKVTIETMELRE